MNALRGHLSVLGASLLGGILGHVACVWMYHHGYYALILPGGLAGIAAGFFRSRSLIVHVLCGLWALAVGLLTEAFMRPFNVDPSLGYFFSHLTLLQPVTLLMIAGGGLLGFFIPFQRGFERSGTRPDKSAPV